jgi:Ni/Fe-hydrogenase subunit HybB-like protein
MAVLLLEIWFDYRRDLILWAERAGGMKKWLYKIISLFSSDISTQAVRFDRKAIQLITLIGIPSAFLLHGYVGFIFGSVKANPWWSSVLMPIVFLFSAMVSGVALVLILYMIITPFRNKEIDMRCLDKLVNYLFYLMIIDFALEILDFIHRIYESEESIKILTTLVSDKLFVSLVVIQVLIGMIIPLFVLAILKLIKVPDELRKLVYFIAAILVQVGIFTTRWNVVIGGQLFSKSFMGLTVYKMTFLGLEGLLAAMTLLVLPLVLMYVLTKIIPPWEDARNP